MMNNSSSVTNGNILCCDDRGLLFLQSYEPWTKDALEMAYNKNRILPLPLGTMYSETHIKRQATRQDYLPSAQLAGRWGQMNWIVYGEENYILYWAD